MKWFLCTLILCFWVVVSIAQVTTSSLNGTVMDASGEALIGATVRAVHQPTGTRYASATNADGRYNMANMRVGGPYTIEVTFVGFDAEKLSNIYLKLGEPYVLNVTLTSGGTELQEVVVTADRSSILNADRTGASTNINRDQLETLPTLSRSIQDFTRLSPQAVSVNGSSSTSFGGANNRFNNITIDGAVNNDVFGLAGSGGLPGGQANTQPISLDAIQEVQVVVAPYDITLGNFTGGGVNAVTRSGTNQIQGSIYLFGRNQDFVGKSVVDNRSYSSFKDYQYGLRVGGPIVENKLFFFVNGELGRRSAPLAFNAGEVGSAISLATAQQLREHTLNTYGYDIGSFSPLDIATENEKVFGRMDWNINDRHQLTLRHNYISAFTDNISRSGASFAFGNNAYQFNNKQNITVLELRSNFSNNFSNNLILGYSAIRDNRETQGELFPQIQINNVDGISGNTVFLGSERSSVANELDQDIFEITDNFKYYAGKHTFTIGTHNEFFKFRNLFINNLNGRWDFNSVDDYINNIPSRARVTYSALQGQDRPSAEFSAAQLGFYAQDEIDAARGLKLTLGVRVDIPLLNDKPLRNTTVEQVFPNLRTDQTPSGKLLFSPRLGFNYDVTGDRAVQLRGGVGIFTGRVPFVWMSNQFVNNGLLFGTIDVRGVAINGGNGFEPDVANQRNIGGAVSTVEINAMDKDFKIPQVARFNVAGDIRFPYGIIGTIEGIYSKTINNVLYKDLNMLPSSVSINPGYSNGADQRPLFNSGPAGKISTNYTNVIFLDNTDEGYTYSLTAQVQKSFSFGLNASMAYTYGKSKDVNSGTSSTALSNWEFVQIVSDPNNPPLSFSAYDVRHRLVGSLGYKISYGRDNSFSTGVSVFYSGFSGSPFTYLYQGDLNGDGRFSNDLLYIPRNQSEINLLPLTDRNGVVLQTPEQQWENLNRFIENDSYLSENRGKYTERNGARMPWEHHFDLRIFQDVGVLTGAQRNSLQITLDIFNVGNLLNKDWGKTYFVSNQATELISVGTNGFTFNRSNQRGFEVSDLGSRWQAQFGVRYLFN